MIYLINNNNNNTITTPAKPPQHQHHHLNATITAPPPPSQHHITTTITTTPYHHHHHNSTTKAPPQQQHHLRARLMIISLRQLPLKVYQACGHDHAFHQFLCRVSANPPHPMKFPCWMLPANEKRSTLLSVYPLTSSLCCWCKTSPKPWVGHWSWWNDLQSILLDMPGDQPTAESHPWHRLVVMKQKENEMDKLFPVFIVSSITSFLQWGTDK